MARGTWKPGLRVMCSYLTRRLLCTHLQAESLLGWAEDSSYYPVSWSSQRRKGPKGHPDQAPSQFHLTGSDGCHRWAPRGGFGPHGLPRHGLYLPALRSTALRVLVMLRASPPPPTLPCTHTALALNVCIVPSSRVDSSFCRLRKCLCRTPEARESPGLCPQLSEAIKPTHVFVPSIPVPQMGWVSCGFCGVFYADGNCQ